MVSSQAMAARAARHSISGASASVSFGPNVQMNDDSNPPLPQNETAVAFSLANPMVAVAAANDYVSGGVVVMRTPDGGRHWATTRVTPQFRGTGDFCSGGDPRSPTAGATTPSTWPSCASSAPCRSPRCSSTCPSTTARPGPPGGRRPRGDQLRLHAPARSTTSIFNDKELHRRRQHPDQPALRPALRRPTRSSTCCRAASQRLLPAAARPTPTRCQHCESVADDVPAHRHPARRPRRRRHRARRRTSLHSRRWRSNGALDVGFVSEDCNDSFDPHVLFQRSTDGGASFLPQAVQVDKPGQYTDFLDAAKDDTLPPTSFRAPNTPSIAYSPRDRHADRTCTRTTSTGRSRRRTSPTSCPPTAACTGPTRSSCRSPAPATRPRNDQFFPWVAADRATATLYAIWFDRRRDPANVDINTWQARSTNDGSSWHQPPDQHQRLEPEPRVLHAAARSSATTTGIAVSSTNVYPVWTDGRNNAIARTGIGETDIFTDVEPR